MMGLNSNSNLIGPLMTCIWQVRQMLCRIIKKGKPFIGESFFWNGTGNAKEFAVSCLLDYVQVPCQPGDQAARITILEHNQELRLPVQISLEDGRHDLSFLIVADPFEDMQTNQPDRADTNAILNTYNIFTNNSIQKPRYPVLQTTLQYKLPWVSPFIVSEQNQDLMNANGSMEVWLDGKGGPGEMLEFYLHFGLEGIDLIPNHEMVVMAFLDYEQIPIYVEGEPYLLLVVKHSPFLWESQMRPGILIDWNIPSFEITHLSQLVHHKNHRRLLWI
jgi:hypothetical protein